MITLRKKKFNNSSARSWLVGWSYNESIMSKSDQTPNGQGVIETIYEHNFCNNSNMCDCEWWKKPKKVVHPWKVKVYQSQSHMSLSCSKIYEKHSNLLYYRNKIKNNGRVFFVKTKNIIILKFIWIIMHYEVFNYNLSILCFYI